MNTELLIFNNFNSVETERFLAVYKESTADNASRWYPELEPAEAIKKYESGYLEFMQNGFFNVGGTLYILSDGEYYVSALRLIQLSENDYFLEALETNPGFRNRGYAKQLLNKTIYSLTENALNFTIKSHIEKNNTASINAHLAAGFVITADYITEDGKIFNSDYELTYEVHR